jgi:CRP-like cAMP-binding protein
MEELLKWLDSVYPQTDACLDYLRFVIKPKKLLRNEFLLREGEVCKNIYFISKGLLRCYYLRDNGEDVSAWFLKELDTIVSVDSFYNQTPSYEFIQAVEDCELYHISHAQLQYVYKTFIEFNVIGRILTQKYLELWNNQVRYIRRMSIEERYREFVKVESELAERVPVKYLASYLNMHPDTLSRLRNS